MAFHFLLTVQMLKYSLQITTHRQKASERNKDIERKREKLSEYVQWKLIGMVEYCMKILQDDKETHHLQEPLS